MTFQNIYIKPYNCYKKKTNISNLKKTNDLAKEFEDKEITKKL